MQFAHPIILYATLPVLLCLGLFFWLAEKRSAARLQAFASPELLRYLSQNASPRRRLLKALLFLLATACAGLALARPQWGVHLEEQEGRGLDVMFALDTSRSMAAEDIRPNRLERAKLSILDFVNGLHGDRVGLVAFAGRAFLQCPLTLDYEGFRHTLQVVDTDIIPVPGTDIGRAIREANAAMTHDRNHRILVIITDGEDLEAAGIREARRTADQGMVIHTVGVGSPEGSPIPVVGPNGQPDYHRDMDGNIVLTKVDESTLIAIAAATGGSYTNLGAGEGLETVYQRIREAIPPEDTGTRIREVPIDRFQWFLALAITLFAVERTLSTRRRPSSGAVLAAFALSCVLLTSPTDGSPIEGQRLFEEGEYAASAEAYARVLERRPNDASLLYNYGVSLYRVNDYAGARDAFEKALLHAKPETQERAFFNLGNTLYQLGEAALSEDDIQKAHDLWNQAVQYFESAKELNPEATDADTNANLVSTSIKVISRTLLIQATPSEGGSTAGAGSYARGYSAPIKARAHEGWRFVRWEGQGIEDPENAETTVLLDQDRSIAAVFIRIWNLTVDPADPDLGTAGESGTFDEGAEIPIKAEAFEYYAFKRWSTDSDALEVADPNSAETTVRLTADAHVTAHFVDAYRLNVKLEPDIGGRAGNSGFYEIDSVQPIKAEPRGGFVWKEWRGDGVLDPTAAESAVSMTEDRTVTAIMEREWSLILIPIEEDAGTVEGGGNHPIGSRVEIQAMPAEGFVFDHWEGSGVEHPEEATTYALVQSNEHNLFAVFRKDDSDGDDNQEDNSGEDENESPSDGDGESDEAENDDDGQPEDEDAADDEPESDPSEPEEPDPDSSDDPEPRESEHDEALTDTSLGPEEADQILNLLDDRGKVLPLSEDPSGSDIRSSGRDW